MDSAGNAYVTGYTESTNFPTANPLQAVYGGGGIGDAFVAKLNPARFRSRLLHLPGWQRHDLGYGIAVDSAGNAYVTGHTTIDRLPHCAPAAGSSPAAVTMPSWRS